jgi:hypothetical protein
MLTNLAARAELFHTDIGTAFADLMIDGHRETWPIRSLRFRAWLRRQHYEATGAAPSGAAIGSVLDLLEARAQFDAPQRTIYIRVAEHGGRIYLDLADDRWRAVEIGPDGPHRTGLGQSPRQCAGTQGARARERIRTARTGRRYDGPGASRR